MGHIGIFVQVSGVVCAAGGGCKAIVMNGILCAVALLCRWMSRMLFTAWLQHQARDERGLVTVVACYGAVSVNAQKALERLAQGGYGSVYHGRLTRLLPSKLTRAVEGSLK